MTSDQAAFLLIVFIGEVKRESLTTFARSVGRSRRQRRAYRPHPNSYSALELAWHLASSELWFLDGFLERKIRNGRRHHARGYSASAADVASYYEDNLSNEAR
jgi:hypothetical protein